ncbi:MAG: SH3 domain-containing protein, partial [Kiritimatiellae bacterium]|nr:SH3 domain-containing protein [Kiritimatiellia bacterium]
MNLRPEAAKLLPMNCHFRIALYTALLTGWATVSTAAETRMQVSAGSAALYSQPSAAAQQAGRAARGDILFVSRTDGDWVGIAPPDHIDLWLSKDFIESNRVLARSIQVRSGPGIQFDVVGTLERGARVMPRGEEGEWVKIAPPSSAILWVKRADLTAVQARTDTPIREVDHAPQPKPTPKPAPRPTPQPAPAPAPVAKPRSTPKPPPPVVATVTPKTPTPSPRTSTRPPP